MSHDRSTLDRRRFLQHGSALVAGLAAGSGPLLAADSPNSRAVIAVVGLGRGLDLVRSSMALPNVQLAYVCDVDQQRIDRALKTIAAKQETKVQGVKDLRRILDDKAVDAVFIATPNHWHAPATILACSAGKHVYVEKPGSHNAREGELMVQAARKNNRVVQMGTQRRTWPAVVEAIERVKAGDIGKALFARCWYDNTRPSIGKGKQVPVPANLDYSLWQGPAPEKPYKDNLVHYNWHWHWHWGGGELANNGIHFLDVARWGLGVDIPRKVSCVGGRYHYQDDQETPDTCVAAYDFGDKGITWEGSSCHPRRQENHPFVQFYGDAGSLAIVGSGYRIYDMKGKEIKKGDGPGGEKDHIANFLECIKTGKRPNQDIEQGQTSTLLCHLGNISYRLGRTLHIDPQSRKILNDPEATTLWGRQYREGWEPKV